MSSPERGRWCEEHGRHECVSSRKAGGPCHSNRMVTGTDRCRMHLGRKAQAVIAEKRIEAEAQRLLYQHNAPPASNPLEALQALAGRALAMEAAIGQAVNALSSIRYEAGEGTGEQLRAEVAVLERAMDRAGKLLVDIARLNIDERLVKIEEAKAKVIVEAIEIALAAAGIKGAAATEAKRAAARHLRAVAA